MKKQIPKGIAYQILEVKNEIAFYLNGSDKAYLIQDLKDLVAKLESK